MHFGSSAALVINMALMLTLLSSSLRVKSSLAFVPARSFRASFFATTSIPKTTSTTAGLRRKRVPASGDSGVALVEQLQRQQGLYRDFGFGSFVQAQDATETTEATSSINVSAGNDENKVANIPLVFPLAVAMAANKGTSIEEQPPRMRFAPSPTGSLHVGGARTALYNWLVAKKGQLDFGKDSSAAFVLRIEDTDVARSTRESELSVVSDIKWLGLDWDEGPDIKNAPYGPYRQSERADVYLQAAQRLMQDGKAYRCFCTPEELEEMKAQQEAKGETPRYDNRWRDADPELVNRMLAEQKPYVVRFKVPPNSRVVIDDVVRGTVAWDAQATVGDFILLRSSGVPVYNFCVAVDDAAMGITTVVRAEEHLTNTVRQALVLDALGAPRPRYAHCSLILGEDKQKLSKRHGATSCNQYRLDGYLPDAMINYLALLGWNDGTDNEIFTREELIESFELDRVVKSPSVFDVEKLKWVNSQHMKMLTAQQLLPLVKEQLEWEGLLKEEVLADNPSPEDVRRIDEFALAATALAKQMMEVTKDVALNAKTVLGYNLPATYADVTDQEAKEMIDQGNFYMIASRILDEYDQGIFPQPDESNLLAAFQDASGMDIDKAVGTCKYTQEYMAHMKNMAKDLNVKGRNLFHPIRLALTGEMSGQDVTKQLSLLSLAIKEDSVIDTEKNHVVDFAERMVRLKDFCDSIPEEFRTPRTSDSSSSKSKVDAAAAAKKATSGGATTTSSSSSDASKTATGSSTVDPKDTYDGPPITALDIRVGKITKVWDHPEADKLYCEEIDIGEGEPRQVASGLRPYLKPEDMEGRRVLVLCNLKERKLVGFPSHGMVLCASNADHSDVRLVNPPIDAKIGERVTIPDFDFEDAENGAPYAENKLGKKKVFEQLAPYLVTNKYGIPEFLGRPFMTSAGVCTSPISDGSVG